MRVILASKSVSRREVMDSLGVEYEVIPSNFDEKSIRNDNPFKLAQELSEAKARVIGKKEKYSIVIAGDLFVVFKGKIYEKPGSEEEAFDMLKSFSGQKIHILAGLAVYNSKTKKMNSLVKNLEANFKELSDQEIKDYINKYPVLDFAAAFDDVGLKRFATNAEEILSKPTCIPTDELRTFLKVNQIKI